MKTKKKRLLLGALVASALGLLAAVPFTREGLGGLVRGEAFYNGRPASHWDKRVREYDPGEFVTLHVVSSGLHVEGCRVFVVKQPSPWPWLDRVRALFRPPGGPPTVLDGGEAAVPVLVELLRSEHE